MPACAQAWRKPSRMVVTDSSFEENPSSGMTRSAAPHTSRARMRAISCNPAAYDAYLLGGYHAAKRTFHTLRTYLTPINKQVRKWRRSLYADPVPDVVRDYQEWLRESTHPDNAATTVVGRPAIIGAQ